MTSEFKQANPKKPMFDSYNPDVTTQKALGTSREKGVLEQAELKSANFVSGTSGWRLTASGIIEAVNAILSGAITATSGAIGGWLINATSIYTGTEDHSGYTANAGDVTIYSNGTDASIHTFNWYIDTSGVFHARSGDMTGVSVSGIPNDTSTDISLLTYTHDLVFSASDNDTVAWTSGTITFSNGRTFSISSGNTGNMAALTWIYLDPGTSSTVLQTTTTATTAMGANKVPLAIAQNNADASANATFVVNGGTGGIAITAGSIKTATLSAIVANLGTITAGTVTGATLQTASSGTRFVMTSTSFQGINSVGNVVFEVIVSGGNAGDVIMGDDATGTYAMWDDSAGTFQVFANNVPTATQGFFGGDGSDGALSISSGTTTVSIASANLLVKNYSSISITGTGKLAFSNPASNGSIVILKSSGAVTLTSSTAPMLDMSGMGAQGGTGGACLTPGTNGGDPGTDGTNGYGILDETADHQGIKGANSTGGAGGAILTRTTEYTRTTLQLIRRMLIVACGSGGGGGQGGSTENANTSTGTGGAGGRGGGGLIVECNGAWNFTTALGISVAGAAGSNSSEATHASNETNGGGGGGGGGSRGFFVGLYKTLTSNTGTINTAGGAGGNGGQASTSAGGGGTTNRKSGSGGGGGGAQGGAGGAGAANVTTTTAGTNGSNAGGDGAGGGGGSGGARRGDAGSGTNAGGTGGTAGASENVLVAQNVYFA